VVDGIVFDIELVNAEDCTEPLGAHQWRKAGIKSDSGLTVDGEQLAVAPEILFAGGDFFPADGFFNSLVIIDDLQRAKTNVAHMQRLLGIISTALPAF